MSDSPLVDPSSVESAAPARPSPVTLADELAVPEAFALGDLGMRTFVREALEQRSAFDPIAARLLAQRDAELTQRGEPADDPLAWWNLSEQQGQAYVPAPIVAPLRTAPSTERLAVERALTVSRDHALEVLRTFDRTLTEPMRLFEVFGDLERGNDDLGRWVRYRLRLAALRAAVADPNGALPLQQRVAFDAWRRGDVAPVRFGHVLLAACRLRALPVLLRSADSVWTPLAGADESASLDADRYAASRRQIGVTLYTVSGQLEFLAAVEGNHSVANASLGAQLAWARREHLIDGLTEDVLSSTANRSLSYTGD